MNAIGRNGAVATCARVSRPATRGQQPDALGGARDVEGQPEHRRRAASSAISATASSSSTRPVSIARS